ncbi:MAG: translocation/assembly module TamB domain-containing protein [Deltaproteobacteria bacterium]|nr:translocation/assembly module TamB domain-containing protein [Deltaproteobacteria bacterium]
MPPVPPRLRRRARWPWLVPLALVGLVLVILRTDLVARIAARSTAAFAEGLLGEEVTVATASLSYFPPEIALEGIVVTHRATGERILGVRSIRGRLGIHQWVPGLQQLVIEAPDLSLHLDPDGIREFRDRVQQPGVAARPRRFPWRELVVTDGHFRVEGAERLVEVDDLDVVPAGSGRHDLSFGQLVVREGTIEQTAGRATFAQVELSPRHVDLPDVRFQSKDVAVTGRLRVESEGAIDGDLDVRVSLPAFTTSATDPRRYVDGTVDLGVVLSGPVSQPVADIALATRSVVLWRLSRKDEPTAVALGDLVGPLRVEGNMLRASGLEMRWAEGTVRLDAVADLESKTLVADLLAEGIHLGPALRATGAHRGPWVDFEGKVEAHLTGTVEPFALAGPLSVGVSDLVVRRGAYDTRADVILAPPDGRITGTLALDPHHAIIDGQDVEFGGSRGRAWADIGFGKEATLLVKADFGTLHLDHLQPLGGAGLGGVAELHGELSGPFHHLSAWANIEGHDVVVIDKPIADHMVTRLESADLRRLDFRDIRAQRGRSSYIGDFSLAFLPAGMWIDTQIVIPEGHVSDLTGIFVDIPGLDGRIVGDAVLHGPPNRLTGEVHADLDEIDAFGEMFESGVATAWMDDGILTISDLSLRRREEAVLARGSVGRGYAMNVEIVSDGVRLENLDHLRAAPVRLGGELVADVAVGGTLFDWRPRGRLYLDRTRVGDRSADDSIIDFSTDESGRIAWKGRFLGRAVMADGSLLIEGERSYDVHAELDRVPLHLLYPVAADGHEIELGVTGEIDLAGALGETPAPVGIDARFSDVYLRWNQHELRNPEPWVFAVHGDAVQVPGVSLREGDRTDLTLRGWSIGSDRASFEGGGTLDLDLARLFAPGVPLLEGTASVGVRIVEGSADAPVEVTLDAEGATLRTDYFPHPFSNLRLRARATRHGYTFDAVKADVGGGKFTATGSIAAEGWRPRRYDLSGKLIDARVHYLDYLPPLVGDAELHFDGPVGDLLLGGDIVIEDMQFRDRIDWESKIVSLQASRLTGAASEDRTDYFSMDLSVRAAETVHLRNNLADADASVDLRIIGDTARPGMVGAIIVTPGGRMYLQDREFEITRGEIRYLDPFTFDPDLDILLETDVSGREREYHVYYAVAGPFSDWRTTTSAEPHLSQADINTLLLFGMTRDEFEQYGGVAAVALGAQAVDLITSQAPGTNISELVDRWNISSGITARGSPTLDSSWRLMGQKDLGPYTLTGEFVIDSQDWYLGAERRIARGFVVGSYLTTEEEGRALSLGSAVGAEFKYRWELD